MNRGITVIAGVGFIGIMSVFAAMFAQAPPQPSAGVLYSIMVNGVPVAGNGPVNFTSQPGIVIGPCNPNPAQGRTDCGVAADTAVLLGRQMDQAGTDRSIKAISTCTDVRCLPGLKYVASAVPTLTTYTQNQSFVLSLDQANMPGSTLDIDGLGPIKLQGTCFQICWILGYGSPVNLFIVH